MKVRYKALLLLVLLSMVTYIDRVCISFAGAKMQDDLGMSESQFGWVIGAFAAAYAIFEIPSGALGDRIGPRKVLTRIVLWWSVFTTLTGSAVNFVWLMIVRFLFGAGEAGAYPNSSGAISRWFPVVERARAHGLVWMASRLGAAVTPFLVVSIQENWGWRTSFHIFGVLGVIWGIAWYVWFRDHPSEKPSVTDRELEEIGAGKTAPAHAKMPWGRVFKNPNLWYIMLMYHLYCYMAFFYLSWYGNFLSKGRDFTPADMKNLAWMPYVFGGIANIAGGIISDRLIRKVGLKWGRRTVGLIGLGVSTGFTVATIFTEDKFLTVLFLALGFAGSDFMLPVAWATCLDVGKKYAGAVTGAMNTAGQVGSFTVSVMFGYMVEFFGSYNAPLYPLAAFNAVSTLLWLKIDPTRKLVPEEEESAVEPAAV